MKKLLALAFLIVAPSMHAAMMSNCRWDWEAHNWLKNNQTNGNALSSKAYLAGVAFMQQVKQWGDINGGPLRPRIGRANLYVGNDTNSLQVPIIVDWSHGSYTNDDLIAFAASDYSETNGLTGNTSTKYIRCSQAFGLNLASFTGAANIHFADYCRTASNEASDEAGVGGALGTWGLVHGNGGNTYVFMGANAANSADSLGSGFYLTSRVATNLAYTYRGATEVVRDSANDTSASGPMTGQALVWHAINIDGAILAHTSRTLSYYGVGFGITTNQVAPYKQAVENAQVPFGRKLP